MTVDRLLRRASSTAQFTDVVVVPAPPFAPKKTSVIAEGRAPMAVSRRAAGGRTARGNVSSTGGDVKNSFAPARIDCRMRSGSAASATAKMPAPGTPARSRSMFDIADDASPRVSTMIKSGCAPSRIALASITLTGIEPARSSRPTCFRNASSSERMRPTSCAMGVALLLALRRESLVPRLGLFRLGRRLVEQLLLATIDLGLAPRRGSRRLGRFRVALGLLFFELGPLARHLL